MKITGTAYELGKILDLLQCPNEIDCGQIPCWDCICKYNNIQIERVIE